MKSVNRFKSFWSKYSNWFVLGATSMLVFLWTLFRFITNGANFDVVGQVGLVGQWASGQHEGASLGPTNYLLKMPVYAILNACEFIPPHWRLFVLALIFNLVTFWVIFWIGRKMLRLYGIKNDTYLQFGLLWLATISGRVFWMDHANYRNLEVVGGMLVLLMVLWMLKKGLSLKKLTLLAVGSSIVFFADPLQMYIVGMGVVLYLFLLAIWKFIRHRRLTKTEAGVVAGLLSGVVGSKAFFWLATTILPVTFLNIPRQNITFNMTTLQGILGNTMRIFDVDIFAKSLGVASLRHLVAIVFLGIALWILVSFRQKLLLEPVPLIIFLVVWTYAVFGLSGHASRLGTERYLVLVPVLFVFLLSLVPKAKKSWDMRLTSVAFILVSVSTMLLAGGIARSWPQRFVNDRPMLALAQYAESVPESLVVSGRHPALAANYHAGYSSRIFSSICTSGQQIVLSDLFYDRANWKELSRTDKQVEVAVTPGGIRSEANQCTIASVVLKLGEPKEVKNIPDVGEVLVYQGSEDLAGRLGVNQKP